MNIPPSITTGSTHIKIGEGRNDEGAWHRAMLVAKALYDAGLWDGVEEITINNAYRAHDLTFGLNPQELILGIDYRFERREWSPNKSVDTSKPYLITSYQYRADGYSIRRRDGLLTVRMRWNGAWQAVDHVTYDDEDDAFYVWLVGIEKPQMVDNVWRLEVIPTPQNALIGIGDQVRVTRVVHTRYHELEEKLRRVHLFGISGEVVEVNTRPQGSTHHVRFGSDTFIWLYRDEIDLASAPLPEVIEPRIVNQTYIAVTATCKDCGQQYDALYSQKSYLKAGLERTLRWANSVSQCSVCQHIETTNALQLIETTDERDIPVDEVRAGVDIQRETDGAFLPKRQFVRDAKAVLDLHVFSEMQIADGATVVYFDDPVATEIDLDLQRFLNEHGNDVAALQKALIATTNALNDACQEATDDLHQAWAFDAEQHERRTGKYLPYDEWLEDLARNARREVKELRQEQPDSKPCQIIHTLYQRFEDDVQRRDGDADVNRWLAHDWVIFQITDEMAGDEHRRVVTLLGHEGQPLPDGEREAAIDYAAEHGRPPSGFGWDNGGVIVRTPN